MAELPNIGSWPEKENIINFVKKMEGFRIPLMMYTHVAATGRLKGLSMEDVLNNS